MKTVMKCMGQFGVICPGVTQEMGLGLRGVPDCGVPCPSRRPCSGRFMQTSVHMTSSRLPPNPPPP